MQISTYKYDYICIFCIVLKELTSELTEQLTAVLEKPGFTRLPHFVTLSHL